MVLNFFNILTKCSTEVSSP